MTKDDIETMRILFNAQINELCNQCRHDDAMEMEGIKNRLIQAFENLRQVPVNKRSSDRMDGMTIKEIRSLTGLSQAAFAQKYDIPKRSIENWEEGHREPPAYVLKLLERVIMEDFPRQEQNKTE